MSQNSASAAIGEVRTAVQVLREDVTCQSFIQGSSSLAYASVLIRRGQYELAGHVLKSLESRKAGRFRDIVFYLQALIDIETGLFPQVKTRLVSRLKEQPADMVSLSLLQACIQAELLAYPDGEGSSFEFAFEPEAPPQLMKSEPAPAPAPQYLEPSPIEASAPYRAPEPPRQPPPNNMVANDTRSSRPGREGSGSTDVDLKPFQTVVNDAGTKAFAAWDSMNGDMRCEVREAQLEGVVGELPQLLPNSLAVAVAGLDAGRTIKTCFSFNHLTVTTLHQGHFNVGLITGPLNQSLIAVVRTETLFAKRAGQLAAQSGERDGAA